MEKFHGYIAARSKAEAIRIGKEAFAGFTATELNEYWSECWGNAMGGIHATEPGAWISYEYGRTVWQLVDSKK